MGQRAYRARGFTLVEYALVVALIAVVSVMADTALAHGLSDFFGMTFGRVDQALVSVMARH